MGFQNVKDELPQPKPMSKTADSKAVDSKPEAASPARAGWSEYVEDFRRAGHETVDWIAQYLSRLSDHPVSAKVKPGVGIETFAPKQ